MTSPVYQPIKTVRIVANTNDRNLKTVGLVSGTSGYLPNEVQTVYQAADVATNNLYPTWQGVTGANSGYPTVVNLGTLLPIITSDGGGDTASIDALSTSQAATTVVATGAPTIVYSISGGAQAASFSINSSSGVLTFGSLPSDGSYAVTVKAQNANGSDTQAITATVRTIPVITSNGGGPTASITVAAPSQTVTTVTATGTAPITYSKSGTNASSFTLDANSGVLTFTAASTAGSYAVTVTATNAAGSDSQAITVTVTAVAWAPTDLGVQLQAWFPFDQLAGADGSTVSGLTDASGNSHNSGGIAGGATVDATGLNSLKVLNFLAAHTDAYSWGTSSSTPLIYTNQAAGSVYIVVKSSSAATNMGLWVFGTDSANDHWSDGTGEILTDFGTSVRKDPGAPGVASWHVYDIISASGEWTMFVDGTSFFTTATNTVAWNSADDILGYGASVFFNGKIAEIIFCNAKLSDANRQKAEGYLAWKWGLQANLPSDHPYKNAAP